MILLLLNDLTGAI